MKTNVISGNLATITADGLITAVNSGGMWFGGIDRVIQSVAGGLFHNQLSQKELADSEAHFITGNNTNKGAFKNVVFVIDDLKLKLHRIVLAGLKEAEKNQLSTVSLPTIRMGVMLGVVEKTQEEALEEMARAIRLFKASNPSFVKTITFVVYQNQELETQLKKVLAEN